MTVRLSFTLFVFGLVIILPWWISAVFLFLLIFLFPWYYEAVFLAMTYDLLYGSTIFGLTIAVLIIILLAEELKKRLYVFS